MNNSDSPLIDIAAYRRDGLAGKVGEPLQRALSRIDMNEDEGAYRGFSNSI